MKKKKKKKKKKRMRVSRECDDDRGDGIMTGSWRQRVSVTRPGQWESGRQGRESRAENKNNTNARALPLRPF